MLPSRLGPYIALLPALACGCSLEHLYAGSGGIGGEKPRVLESEAEACDQYGNFVVQSDPAASGGSYMVVPEEMGCHGDQIRCSFQVDVAGSYRVKSIVAMGPAESTDDSFLVRVDGEPVLGIEYTFDGTEFHSDYVGNPDIEGELLELELDPGPHVVTFECREDGSKVDWIALDPVAP
ncbi:hypothetical protein [Polyangium aurulentum]|uniref:hypothetical protein n=1 Tax=Polyangium aurulentum TaxID=2567896 RepID=UPI0010AE3093|nr:hypothetical protein [Polyangium aurulentum]UQA59868.1 hypothetical protein E8A73_005050 [Polyangium aurulentum]